MPSQRETEQPTVFERWRGLDQTTQPTLVQSGFFSMARGVFFSIAANAERLPGKVFVLLVPEPVFSLTVFGGLLLIQGMTTLWFIEIAELQVPSSGPSADAILTEDDLELTTESDDPLLIE